ncbi:MAG: acetyl-CoA carboxylase biotin carboxyl carrier protein [Planctomycetes bacterium]|nr:acetyl-CoA carboxylase biotin carboxyl carrier protein [Planctomycetota bacterium]MBU1517700.1 acetyl-CoA carboxylase biotin carboxyl carrier protein [Planctomycetota bacterium]MBU2457239.1 acetyl-CoA carboxylase biotin carboxyl carrier protein [Planctomycetota bacterium]MBU2596182.1 acetyl-CoA carboxylase biotin carboxyl carrier protein [Planctomycetota bacterium]
MGDEKTSNLKRVKELIDLMIEKDLVEVEIVDGDNKIHLKRPGSGMAGVPAAPMSVTAPAAPAATGATPTDNLVNIPSPIIGTFYSAASPDSPPYAKVGDHVTPDTVVCIVEAMKVMNEIKAETTGTIEKVMVATGQAVEFGQVLFKVRPD